MPAPNEPLRAPYPNLVISGFPRIACHVITINFTGTAPAIVQARSSPGVTVSDAGVGRAGFTFPAGGTGASGWFLMGPVEHATPSSSLTASLDADLTNFATGVGELDIFATDADNTADDSTEAVVTLMVFVLLGPGGAV